VAFDKLKNLFNVNIKDGVKGSAVVQSSSVPTEAARSYNVSMWLDVYVEGREPYRVKHECMVKAGKHPWPGATLPVVVDPENPKRIDIQWEDLRTVDERMAEGPGPGAQAMGQPEVIDLRGTDLAEQLRGALAAAGAAPEGGNMVEDRIAKLERLSKLRESGVLSEAEFEAEKARILAG
jgi:putative oligomerization/nucleic acid binding protein